MAVRATMAYIITFVRELIYDTGATQKFTDQQIQDRLDLSRLDLYADCLKAPNILDTDGTIDWKDFYARYPFWETDFTIQKIDGTLNPPTTSEPLIGKFTYATHQEEPLVINGRVYNVYGVASNLMTTWIAELRTQIQYWSADGTTVQRIGQIRNMQDLAAEYAKKAWGWGNSTQIKLVRKDLKN